MNQIQFDVLRGQMMLMQAAVDALLATHPEPEKVAAMFDTESAELLSLFSSRHPHRAALENAHEMRDTMLARLRRT